MSVICEELHGMGSILRLSVVSEPARQSVCIQSVRALVVQLMLLHGNEQQDGKRVIKSTGVPQKCQVTVH